jgi:uncharacterized 2Fe-2S/4Fe-4S cluster protein (DUF4445 family)
MKKTVIAKFEPEGKRAFVKVGSSVLEAAREVGVGIRSECGGDSKCGKCRVIIEENQSVSELNDSEKRQLTPLETQTGYRLACCALLRRNATIVIPNESRIGFRKMQISGMEGEAKLQPAVRKVHLILPKPTILDAKPDFERLLLALNGPTGLKSLDVDYELLKSLPEALRNANWDVTLTIWKNQRIISIESGNTANALYGFAVDIGTSKVVGYLVDLNHGKVVGAGAIENPQIAYGEDIMSRIEYAITHDGGPERLQKLVVDGINTILKETCKTNGVDPRNVYEMTVVGNTVMHHLFLRIPSKYISMSPYSPAIKKAIDLKASELGLGITSSGNVHVLPVIAGYVGADAVADVLATGIYDRPEMCLVVDIGTNGEVFVGNRDDIVSCSCAAGPAFEGAHIRCGMKAVTGAIEKVRIDPLSKNVELEVIGGEKPVGVCGSGMVDVVAEMLKTGILTCKGHFVESGSSRIRRTDGSLEFVLASASETGTGKPISLTQQDIAEIILAKAALHTGCTILMDEKGVTEDTLDKVFIAGAFGNYINPENAKILGLIPDVPTRKITFAGNTALAGAKMSLVSMEARETAELISRRTRYIELMTAPNFKKEFAHSLRIPYSELAKYPSVLKSCPDLVVEGLS